MKPRVHWVARLTGAPAWMWRDTGPWWARVRRWFVHTISRADSESCDACGCAVPGCWWVDSDASWRKVYTHLVGEEPTSTDWGVSGGLLCPNCVTRGAHELDETVVATLGYGLGLASVRFVFAGESPDLTFIEVEDLDGRSLEVGEWSRDGNRATLGVRLALK